MHVNNVCKSCFYHLRNIKCIRKYLSKSATESLVHALVSSRLDYCNSLLYGLPSKTLHKLQLVQNTAARIITGTSRHDHITPVLFSLHWLPVEYRIQFKLLLLVYKSLHNLAPVYISDLITKCVPNISSLRSSDQCLLRVPRSSLKTCGDRSFVFAAPKLWNSLPLQVKTAHTVNVFKNSLKSHLFRKAFSKLLEFLMHFCW